MFGVGRCTCLDLLSLYQHAVLLSTVEKAALMSYSLLALCPSMESCYSVKCASLNFLRQPQQFESLRWRSGKVGSLLLRVPFLHFNYVPVAAVLPVEIELLQQLNSFFLCAHTVNRGRLFQERYLNIGEQEETPDSKPTTILGMDTYAIDLLERKKKDLGCLMLSLVMVTVQSVKL